MRKKGENIEAIKTTRISRFYRTDWGLVHWKSNKEVYHLHGSPKMFVILTKKSLTLTRFK